MDHGTLRNTTTGESIRPATELELIKSAAANYEGTFDLDGVSVYVDGGDLSEQFFELRDKARAAGDYELDETCDSALDGDEDAQIDAARALLARRTA